MERCQLPRLQPDPDSQHRRAGLQWDHPTELLCRPHLHPQPECPDVRPPPHTYRWDLRHIWLLHPPVASIQQIEKIPSHQHQLNTKSIKIKPERFKVPYSMKSLKEWNAGRERDEGKGVNTVLTPVSTPVSTPCQHRVNTVSTLCWDRRGGTYIRTDWLTNPLEF